MKEKAGRKKTKLSKFRPQQFQAAKDDARSSSKPKISLAAHAPVANISVQEATVLNELPFSYNETKLVLLVRDPYWAFSYWDFSGETWNWIQKKFSEESNLKPMMRIYDLDAKRSYHLLISLETKNWYLHLGTPDHRYVAELGLGDGNTRFYRIARSNEVRTPRDSPSEEIDPEWNARDFEEIYRLSGSGNGGISLPGSLFFTQQS